MGGGSKIIVSKVWYSTTKGDGGYSAEVECIQVFSVVEIEWGDGESTRENLCQSRNLRFCMYLFLYPHLNDDVC